LGDESKPGRARAALPVIKEGNTMAQTALRWSRRPRPAAARLRRAAILAVVALAAAAFASAASAATVRVVSKTKSGTNIYGTIQGAVNAASPGDWVLIEPGEYDESVLVETPGLKIRGMNRNTVIVDGQNESLAGGRNGIEVFKTNNVSIENLTARNFDRAERDGGNGNEIWWNGGDGTGKIGAEGWHGAYLTAYDTGLLGGYGLFVSNSVHGSMENVYASGFNDSGLYIGACRDCHGKVTHATVENSSLGYSGTNAGGHLVIERSIFRHNTAGLVPNSLAGDDEPPPQDGACNSGENTSETPTFTSTKIARCTIFRNNLFTENNNLTTPGNSTTAASPWGIGVELVATSADLLEHNAITNNANNGVLGFEFPNGPGPTFFQLTGNKIYANTFSGNGTTEASFAGDVTLEGGLFPTPELAQSVNNCVSGNTFSAPTSPANIQQGWGCQNKTTPNPGFESFEYINILSAESQARTQEGQPAPPAQPTMPSPCKGVPKNALCS
jgi:hypothetical protein